MFVEIKKEKVHLPLLDCQCPPKLNIASMPFPFKKYKKLSVTQWQKYP